MASLAVVTVVYDIVTDVVVSCDLGEPDVEEDGHPDHIECERDEVPAAAIG